MKRTSTQAALSATGALQSTKTKKVRHEDPPAYHLTPSERDEQGNIIWPAPQDRLDAARAFIIDWYVVI
jgi:hypothetical protein